MIAKRDGQPMYEAVFGVIVCVFVAFYGLCLLTRWPVDVARGIGLLERRSPVARRAIGVLLIAVAIGGALFELLRSHPV